MANRAYAALWLRASTGEREMRRDERLAQFEQLLRTVPFARTQQGFRSLVIRALDPSETPVADHDLRTSPATSLEVVELAREHAHPDTAFEVEAYWDLWVRDPESGLWSEQPQKLEIIAHGPEYDGGVAMQEGDFLADLGFEHLFTGHAHLLAARAGAGARTDSSAPVHPEEARFFAVMTRPENLREYREKTSENIRRLMNWVRAAETAVPAQRSRMWSEGEENFEARLDEILTAG